MLIVVRHGDTAFNEPPEKFRGRSDIPLNKEGMQDAKDAAEKIGKLHLPTKVLYSSNTVRALQTAEHISAKVGIPVTPTEGLSDWDYGFLTGTPVEAGLPLIQYHSEMQPDLPIPGGESYNAFIQRVLPFLRWNMMQDEPLSLRILVTHNRVIRHFLAWLEAGKVGFETDPTVLSEEKDPLEPGDILELDGGS